jgi:organic radical activating enzyme
MIIKEIFFSYQAEGKYIGSPTVFVRFGGCNLSCYYCDTQRAKKILKKDGKNIDDVLKKIVNLIKKYKPEFISLTGGEPLLQNENEIFNLLKKLKESRNIKVYFESNMSIKSKLKRFIDLIDVFAINLKLPIDDRRKLNTFNEVKRNIRLCKKFNKEYFLKIVVSKNFYDKKLLNSIVELIKFANPKLVVLQPETKSLKYGSKNLFFNLSNLYHSLYNYVKHIHIIPQLHKFVWKIK